MVRERSVHIVALEHESHQSLRPSNSGSFVGARAEDTSDRQGDQWGRVSTASEIERLYYGSGSNTERRIVGKPPDWSRSLPRPLTIPVNAHLPKDRRERQTWRLVAKQPGEAAAGTDTVNVAISLRLASYLMRTYREQQSSRRLSFPEIMSARSDDAALTERA